MTATYGGDEYGSDDGRSPHPARHRELILDVVRTYGRPLSLSTLEAAIIAGSSRPNDAIGNGGLEDENLKLRLHHVHLPKLNQSGAIDYDVSRRVVRPELG